MIKKLISTIPRFYDDEGKRVYRRIMAGVAWPFDVPGAIVILGECDQPNPSTGEYDLWMIDEYKHPSLVDIMVRCAEAKQIQMVQKFYADTSSRDIMLIARRSDAGVRLLKAPYSDTKGAGQFYLTLIRERLSYSKKSLNFGPDRKTPSLLSSISTDKAIELPPLVQALGYVVAAFSAYLYEIPNDGVHVTYRPLDPVVGY